MANQLMNIVRFVGVAPGVTTSLPHELTNEGQALTPDVMECTTVGSFNISADAVNVTVTNNGSVASSIDIYCVSWHTTVRVLGAQPNLTPRPFIVTASSGTNTGAVAAKIVGGNVPALVSGAPSVPLPFSVTEIAGPPGMVVLPTIVIPLSGIYTVTLRTNWGAVASAAPATVLQEITKNGLPADFAQAQGESALGVSDTVIFALNAGDIIGGAARQTNPGGLTRAVLGDLAVNLVR